MNNLQIMVKAMGAFCKDCPKNNTVECNPLQGDYCEALKKFVISLQEKMKGGAE
jgi:hypothetical protein